MATKNMKVFVDTPNCISCGACIAISESKIFGFDQSSKSYVIKQPETDQEKKIAFESSEACPVCVIHIEEVEQKVANDNNIQNNMAA